MKLWNGIGAAFVGLGLSLLATAQTTTPPPATCKTAPTGITALSLERAVPLADVLTTLTPSAPPATLAGLAGGALEIRELLIYNAQLNAVTSTVFAVPVGSPLPSPAGTISGMNVLVVTVINISQVWFSCSPAPSVLLVGTVSQSMTGLYPNFVGATAAISIGYTTDSPAKINNVAVVVSGLVLEWSAAATGTLTLVTPSTGGSGGTGTGPTAVIKFPNGTIGQPSSIYQVTQSPLLLDATGSTGGTPPLTYAWSASTNSPVAFVSSGTPGMILVQFPAAGGYTITLTVTDSTGASNSTSVNIQFTGRPN